MSSRPTAALLLAGFLLSSCGGDGLRQPPRLAWGAASADDPAVANPGLSTALTAICEQFVQCGGPIDVEQCLALMSPSDDRSEGSSGTSGQLGMDLSEIDPWPALVCLERLTCADLARVEQALSMLFGCMRQFGVDIPEPEVEQPDLPFPPPNRNDPPPRQDSGSLPDTTVDSWPAVADAGT